MRIAVLLLALCFVSASQAAGDKSAERRLARQLEKAYKQNSSRELNRFMEEWSEKYSPNGPESGPMNDTLTAVYELFGSLYSPNLKREPDIWPDSLFPRPVPQRLCCSPMWSSSRKSAIASNRRRYSIRCITAIMNHTTSGTGKRTCSSRISAPK